MMRNMYVIRQIRGNRGFNSFFFLYGIFFIVGLVLFAFIKRGDVVLFVNKLSREWFDSYAEYITDLGLGSIMAVLMLLLIFWRIRYAIIGLLDLAIVGIFTNLIKKSFYSQGRPFKYLYYDDLTRFIHTAELNYFSSFPSGHTMTIFAVMSLLAYLTGKKWVGIVFFLIALMVGFSRIYMLQHFFVDVYFGSFLGIVATFLALWLAEEKLKFMRNRKLNGSIFSLFGDR